MGVDRSAVVATRSRNPCATLQDIADKYEVSRERIRQILSEEQASTKSISRASLLRICPLCGGFKSQVSILCSRCREAEWAKVRWVTLICDQCEKTFNRRQAHVLNRAKRYGFGGPVFCSRRCQGIYTAEHYGIGTPNNPIHKTVFPHGGGSPRKWDYSELYRLADETGWGCNRLGRTLGIPRQTAWRILRNRTNDHSIETPDNQSL